MSKEDYEIKRRNRFADELDRQAAERGNPRIIPTRLVFEKIDRDGLPQHRGLLRLAHMWKWFNRNPSVLLAILLVVPHGAQ